MNLNAIPRRPFSEDDLSEATQNLGTVNFMEVYINNVNSVNRPIMRFLIEE